LQERTFGGFFPFLWFDESLFCSVLTFLNVHMGRTISYDDNQSARTKDVP
jgi:hypothetical protein